MVSFALWKLLTLIRCHLFVFIFITLEGESETILLKKKITAGENKMAEE